MRHLLVTASALTLLLAGGAAFAQSGQGGAIGSNPANNSMSTPSQGTGGPGNNAYPGSSSSGSSGVPTGTYQDQTTGQGNTTYDAPGKVGGNGSHR